MVPFFYSINKIFLWSFINYYYRLSLYFNNKGLAKISLGIAEGKKKVDKREVIKKRDWNREKHRLLKNNN